MSIKKSVGNVKGFTLVELLIVVAIIGVLASQGVPAYRRMIQKSKKGEAQNFLASISSGESAFFAEYGSYGNNIARMGVAVDGYQDANGLNYTYSAGVDVPAGCAAVGAAAIVPTALTVSAIANNPNYVTVLPGGVGTPVALVNFTSRIGRLSQTACSVTTGTVTNNVQFLASATGYIRGDSTANMNSCNANVANCDQWTINQNRQMINLVDGIRD
jgi:prepilin-type N-terminal cleavage/methylation domain-containing protein